MGKRISMTGVTLLWLIFTGSLAAQASEPVRYTNVDGIEMISNAGKSHKTVSLETKQKEPKDLQPSMEFKPASLSVTGSKSRSQGMMPVSLDANFKVDSGVQKNRDASRMKILQDELETEMAHMKDKQLAMKRLGPSEPKNEELRIALLESVTNHEKNIMSLLKELQIKK